MGENCRRGQVCKLGDGEGAGSVDSRQLGPKGAGSRVGGRACMRAD